MRSSTEEYSVCTRGSPEGSASGSKATSGERIGPAYDTPTLRGLHDSAPYFHDGSAATLYQALTRPTPGIRWSRRTTRLSMRS